MKANPGVVLWRVAVLGALLWIGLELHWLRQEMPQLPWDFDSQLADIQRKLVQIDNHLSELVDRPLWRP